MFSIALKKSKQFLCLLKNGQKWMKCAWIISALSIYNFCCIAKYSRLGVNVHFP